VGSYDQHGWLVKVDACKARIHQNVSGRHRWMVIRVKSIEFVKATGNLGFVAKTEKSDYSQLYRKYDGSDKLSKSKRSM
jgi:hypothetical protein